MRHQTVIYEGKLYVIYADFFCVKLHIASKPLYRESVLPRCLFSKCIQSFRLFFFGLYDVAYISELHNQQFSISPRTVLSSFEFICVTVYFT